MEDGWQSVSLTSPSFRQELLVLNSRTDPSDGRRRQESSLDPQKRVPVSMKLFFYSQSCLSESDGNTGEETFTQNQQTGSGCSGSSDNLTLKIKSEAAEISIYRNTSLDAGMILPKVFMVHGPNEPDQENPQIYRGTEEPGPLPGSRSPQRADDPIQQQILMLEDDEVVRTSAASLYHKHPAVSSLHVVDAQQRVQQVKGRAVVLSEHSSLVLVGHGARDGSGEMRISGYTSKDVARIIQNSSRISQKIQTTTVVACEAGSDRRFGEALLKELHEAGIETELHLWTTVVQVTESGEVISQDVSAGGAQWRSGDHTKKVVLTVGRKGEIRSRKESEHRGRQVLTNHTRLLGNCFGKVCTNRDKDRYSWPKAPERFVPDKVINEMLDQLKENVKELEGLSWGLFHPDQPIPKTVDVDSSTLNVNNYVIGKLEGKRRKKITWLTTEEEKKKILEKCYVIESGKDIRNIARHFAKDGENENKYLMVNKWIYEVDPRNLYIYPVGKQYDPNKQPSVDQIKNSIEVQMNKEDYPHIKEGLFESVKNIKINIEKECAKYFKGIFYSQQSNEINPVTAEAWCTTYFVASVISESSRNFRTFPLILMALDMTDGKRTMSGGLMFLFHEHSMTRGGSWINTKARGFTGSATPDGSSKHKTRQELMNDLKNVLYREDIMFMKWKHTVGEKKSYETYVHRMAEITEKFKVFDDDVSEQTFNKECVDFKNKVDKKKDIVNNTKAKYNE